MRWVFTVAMLIFPLAGCAILPGGKPAAHSNVYLLETRLPSETVVEPGCQVIVVNPPESAPGQSGSQMLYQRHPNQLERFAFSRWAASPAMMLEPLLLDALRGSNGYGAVLSSPAPVGGDLRVENDGLWLIQRFAGDSSELELRMSTRLYSPQRRRLVDARDFRYTVTAAEATPVAGVAAADEAVRRLLRDFSAFVAAAAATLDTPCEGDG